MATYKSILESLCKIECDRWLRGVLKTNDFEYLYTDFINPGIEFDRSRDLDGFTFHVFIRVRLAKINGGSNFVDLRVTGFVYSYGVEPCSLWDSKNNLLWLDSENLRKKCKIEKLEL